MKRTSVSKKGDVYAAIFSIGIGLVATYAFFYRPDGYLDSAYSMEVEVGDLSSQNRGVRYRLNKSIAWQDVASSEQKKIRMGDEVFTTFESTARIALKDGTEFTIDPNSYIAFEKLNGDNRTPSGVRTPVLSIKKGRVQVRLSRQGSKSGSQPIVIGVAGKFYSLNEVELGQKKSITLVVDETSKHPIVLHDNAKVADLLKEVTMPAPALSQTEETQPEEDNSSTVRISLSSLAEVSRAPAKESPVLLTTPTPQPSIQAISTPPPLPEPSPGSSQAVAAVDPALAKSSVAVGIGTTYFRIDGVDPSANGKSVVLSELSPKLELFWNLDWNEKNTFNFYGGLERFSLKSFRNTQSLARTDGIRSALGFGYLNHWNDRLTLGASVQLRQSIFFRSSSPTLLDVNTVLIVSPGLSLRYELLHKNNAGIGLIEEFSFLLPTDAGDYTIKSGFSGTTGFYMQYRGRNNERGMEGQIFYRYESQDSSISTRVETNLGMKLLYFWRLD